MPRIIAGSKKKMTLITPKGMIMRPTTDRIKENVFNVLAPFVEGAMFLDLYAGTGQIGLEALSRGAARCVFIEKSGEIFRTLSANIEKTRFQNYEKYRMDALRYIEKAGHVFDLIYLDPPYASEDYGKVLECAASGGLLAIDGKIVVEHASEVEINDFCGILEKYKEDRYGTIKVTYLVRR